MLQTILTVAGLYLAAVFAVLVLRRRTGIPITTLMMSISGVCVVLGSLTLADLTRTTPMSLPSKLITAGAVGAAVLVLTPICMVIGRRREARRTFTMDDPDDDTTSVIELARQGEPDDELFMPPPEHHRPAPQPEPRRDPPKPGKLPRRQPPQWQQPTDQRDFWKR